MEASFISRIKEKLSTYAEARIEEDEGRIWVLPVDENGFTVLIFKSGDTFSVYYNGWHEEFEDEESAVTCFLDGLGGRTRIIEERRGGNAYRWTMERKQGDGWWPVSVTGLLLVPFWKRKRPVTLQNRLFAGEKSSSYDSHPAPLS